MALHGSKGRKAANGIPKKSVDCQTRDIQQEIFKESRAVGLYEYRLT